MRAVKISPSTLVPIKLPSDNGVFIANLGFQEMGCLFYERGQKYLKNGSGGICASQLSATLHKQNSFAV
jgi:hypothetical protein